MVENNAEKEPRHYRVIAAGLGATGMERTVLVSTRWADFDIDVFYDRIVMCHTIDLQGRLEIDSPTITLADILLQKLQVVKVTEKDLTDAIILLREHDLGDGDDETVNVDYIAKLLGKDWGFWYTVTTNLSRLKEWTAEYPLLTIEDREDVEKKIDRLLTRLHDEPKSLRWKMRSRIGTKRPWYRQVEEVIR